MIMAIVMIPFFWRFYNLYKKWKVTLNLIPDQAAVNESQMRRSSFERWNKAPLLAFEAPSAAATSSATIEQQQQQQPLMQQQQQPSEQQEDEYYEPTLEEELASYRRSLVVEEWAELLWDLPFVLLGLTITVFPFLLDWLMWDNRLGSWRPRDNLAEFAAVIILFGLPWRAILMVKDMRFVTTAQERRRLALHHSIKYILDPIALVMSFIVFITGYRAEFAVKQAKAVRMCPVDRSNQE